MPSHPLRTKRLEMKTALFIGFFVAARLAAADLHVHAWNASGAARFLDQRAAWWASWPQAARDHHTFCVSCHTTIPYALARTALRATLHEQSPSNNERELRENVGKRVRLWTDVQPYYPGQDRESRGTEAVANAVVLASLDASAGHLSTESRAALDGMWALQQTAGAGKGAWPWINFRNEPWEGNDSPFYGACLAAIAAGIAPGDYQAETGIRPHIDLLHAYLTAEYPKQSLLNQAFLLWGSARIHALLTVDQQRSIVNALLNAQRDDGGWSVSSIAWSLRAAGFSAMSKVWRSDASPLYTHSDGLATGVVVTALEQYGLRRGDAHLDRALAWLSRNQNAEGEWRAESLNKHRDPSPGPGLFMTDAATAFAALALANAR
jgi:squalene-hopene/tetraprenyl-beta-curcumene cyclase